MQTHEDNDARGFMERLTRRAEEAKARGEGQITAGAPDEAPLAKWQAECGMYLQHLPDDPQGILRISIGGGDHLPVTLNYCTVRGDIGQCIKLLERAIEALRNS